MAISVRHKFQSLIPDKPKPGLVRPSNWNDEHDMKVSGPSILGRTDSGQGPAQELSSADVAEMLEGHFATVAQGEKADTAVQPGDIPKSFASVPALLADTSLSYGNIEVSATITASGYRYAVAASDAVDHHLITAGGVKLYVLPNADGAFNLAQLGDSPSLQLMVNIAAGRKITLPPGEVTAKNVDVTDTWLEFPDSASIYSPDLGATENGLYSVGGTRITGSPHFEVSNAEAPVSGEYGNIIRFGKYVTDATVYSGLEIENPLFVCRNATALGLAVSCLGRAENVRLRGVATMRGCFGGGFQAHWGGVFDGGDPHAGNVSASYHPNNIKIDTLVLEAGGPSDLTGHLGLSLSAAYDVEIGTLINRGWDRTDWIQPGDVYDLVAAPDQAPQIMGGIRIAYTEVINPVQNTTPYNNVLVSGVSATIRTAGQTEVVCAADRHGMSVDHGEVHFICAPGYTYNTNPLARMTYAKNSKMEVFIDGAGSVTTSEIAVIYNVDCAIKLHSKTTTKLIIGRGNIRHTYDVDWRSPNISSPLGGTQRVVTLGGAAGSATIGTAVVKGDTSIAISAWSDVSLGSVIKGTRLYLDDGSFVTLRRSQLIGTGVTSIDIDPAPAAISSGVTLSASCCELDSIVRGSMNGAYIAIEMSNVDGVSVPAKIRRSAKNDVLHTGVINRRLLYNGDYDQCGQLDDGSTLVNIHLGANGVINHSVSVVGAKFESSGSPKVSANVYGRAANNQTAGLLVTDCDLRSTGYPVNYLYPTVAAFEDLGPPQVYGNRNHNGPTAYDFDPAQGAAMRAGPVWYYYRNSVPSVTANRPTGSRWINLLPAAGGPRGSTWTSGGWVVDGQVGALASVAATPAFVGQQAVVSGVGYVAVGTASNADWKQTT